jgi:hypothetical protein
MLIISDKIYDYVDKQDTILSNKNSVNMNELRKLLYSLEKMMQVEVGWRESCGKTDSTVYIKRAWDKVIKKLIDNGNVINQEYVKHNNSYATLSGGFWNSIIYKTIS